MAELDPKTGRPVKRSTGLWGWNTIYGRDDDKGTPYMTRVWIGRLRLHIFYRGDSDPDPHDHPWPFWTFPLTSYVEEVFSPSLAHQVQNIPEWSVPEGYYPNERRRQVVPAFWPSPYQQKLYLQRICANYGRCIEGYDYK